MDNFDNNEFYGHNLSKDPQLRTTARTYDFKYTSSDRLEKIINRVQMEREMKKTRDSGRYYTSTRTRPSQFKQSLPAPESIPSQDTIVKVMSDAEIEEMISQALHSWPSEPALNPEQGDAGVSLKEPQKSEIQLKYSKTSEEIILCEQPQWVQIKPAEKAVANMTDGPASFDGTTLETALNLGEQVDVDGHMGEDNDRLDLLCDASSSDLILRNDEQEGEVTTLHNPLSFGIDTPLNNSADVLRLIVPNIPPMDLNAVESETESVFSESTDDEEEDENEEPAAEDITRQVSEVLEANSEPQQSNRRKKSPSNISCEPPKAKPRSNSKHSPQRIHPSTPLDTKMKKQIEALKQEKIRIFSKMTSIQEKMIEVLDKLRISLVELSLPDEQVEVKIRERNAFEFTVRLSRNYLFPLGRMLEELRQSPKELFQSATTNEPCVKVCGIYGLLNQALQCYHKQLRNFFTDKVPKKLDILLNLITDTTNVCLQKKIFDQRDSLIQCLLQRCNVFTKFILTFDEQKKIAREEDRPPKSSRRSPQKTSSKWDLTMNLNNLNMYEPKLMPKAQKRKQPKKHIVTARLSSRSKGSKRAVPMEKDCLVAPLPDPDDTQVRRVDVTYSESVQIFNNFVEEQPESELTRTLIEALQNITKDEVHQILGPMLSNLNSALQNSDNPESVESVLSLLNSQLMARYEADGAAAENSPQANDTDQNEASRRSSNYRKEERQTAKSSKYRSNEVAARKPGRLINNTANVKQGSTKATKQRDVSSGHPNTGNERHSLSSSNVAVQHADKNDAKKRSFRSCTVLSDKAAKKPTPAVTTSPLDVPPPPPPTPPTPPTTAPLNEVIPPRSRPHSAKASVSKHRMTSQCIEANNTSTGNPPSSTLPSLPPAEVGANNKQKADKFAPEKQKIDANGGSSKEFRKQIAAKSVADSGEEKCRLGRESKGGALLATDQVETFAYSKNVMYTFAKSYADNATAIPDPEPVLNVEGGCTPEEEFFTESRTRLRFSSKSSLNPSFKSTFESSQNLLPPDNYEELQKEIQKLIEKRNNFIERFEGNPLYTNPQFPQPWKVLSKISNHIANEIIGEFENDLSFGEESYVRDFINTEMQT